MPVTGRAAPGGPQTRVIPLNRGDEQGQQRGDTLFREAVAHHQAGRLAEAEARYRRLLADNPGQPDLLKHLGIARAQQGDLAGALDYLGQATAAAPERADLHYDLGLARQQGGDLEGAETAFRRAVALAPEAAFAWNNLAVVLAAGRNLDEAADCCAKAIALQNGYADAHVNLGNIRAEQGDFEAAISAYRAALASAPHAADTLAALAQAHFMAGDLDAAADEARNAVALDGNQPDALSTGHRLLLETCAWDEADAIAPRLDAANTAAIAAGVRTPERPFAHLARSDDGPAHLALAGSWAAEAIARTAAARAAFGPPVAAAAKPRLTIGYLSCDLRNHPVGQHLLGLFPAHDREALAVNAYAIGPDDGGPVRAALADAADTFTDLAQASHLEAARRIRTDGVDILVDLTGWTRHGRPEIAALRPAPLQVLYFGHPGTGGGDLFDYCIVDPVIVPAEEAGRFSESLAWLSGCYQPNPRPGPLPDAPTRAEMGLPSEAVVLAALTQSYKIDRTMFSVWIRLMAETPDAVLWLLRASPTTEAALRRAAEAGGVDATRLIFADKLPRDEHLARLACADLVLDTRLYNGHTTTTDALLAGVPVVALAGAHFPARVSASILKAHGLEDLIAADLDGFATLAGSLAGDDAARAAFRTRIAETRADAPLFNPDRIARDLERLYRAMWTRAAAGEPPAPIGPEA